MTATILKTGAIYFAIVFAAGFVLGPIRVIWAVPRFGTMIAELMEAPIMLTVIVLAARRTVRRFGSKFSKSALLSTGIVALALLLFAEFAVVLGIRGMSVREYVAGRDPVSGTVYVLMLGLFAVMPLFVAGKMMSSTESAPKP